MVYFSIDGIYIKKIGKKGGKQKVRFFMYNAFYSLLEKGSDDYSLFIFLMMEAELMSKSNPVQSSKSPSVMTSNLYKGKLILIILVL